MIHSNNSGTVAGGLDYQLLKSHKESSALLLESFVNTLNKAKIPHLSEDHKAHVWKLTRELIIPFTPQEGLEVPNVSSHVLHKATLERASQEATEGHEAILRMSWGEYCAIISPYIRPTGITLSYFDHSDHKQTMIDADSIKASVDIRFAGWSYSDLCSRLFVESGVNGEAKKPIATGIVQPYYFIDLEDAHLRDLGVIDSNIDRYFSEVHFTGEGVVDIYSRALKVGPWFAHFAWAAIGLSEFYEDLYFLAVEKYGTKAIEKICSDICDKWGAPFINMCMLDDMYGEIEALISVEERDELRERRKRVN
jgi:hypothetical protein